MRVRAGEGGKVVSEAAAAVARATADGVWNNAPVSAAAPYAEIISKYITPSQIVTLSTEDGDLVFCIRAAAINDKELMSALTVEQVARQFLQVESTRRGYAASRH